MLPLATSAEILEEVYERFGKLPHSNLPGDGTSRKNWSEQIHQGEVAFTNGIHALGYKLKKLRNEKKPYTRWTNQHCNADEIFWGEQGWVTDKKV